ncbi:hypothetical protein D3C71_1016540 [compost metagenome]
MFQIIGVVGHPKYLLGTRSITEYDVHELWLHTLDRDQHSRVERNLHKEFGLGRFRQLGVDNLIAVVAQRRRSWHFAQEVGMANIGAFLKRRLEDDIGAGLHGLDGKFHPARETRIALGDVDYVGIFAFEPLEKGRLVGQALVLYQSVLIACRGFYHRHDKVLKV